MASGLSTTQLEVTWALPDYGCDAVGYRIYYGAANSDDDLERSEFAIIHMKTRILLNGHNFPFDIQCDPGQATRLFH